MKRLVCFEAFTSSNNFCLPSSVDNENGLEQNQQIFIKYIEFNFICLPSSFPLIIRFFKVELEGGGGGMKLYGLVMTGYLSICLLETIRDTVEDRLIDISRWGNEEVIEWLQQNNLKRYLLLVS